MLRTPVSWLTVLCALVLGTGLIHVKVGWAFWLHSMDQPYGLPL